MFFGTSKYIRAALLALSLSSKSINAQLNLPSLLGRMDGGGVTVPKSMLNHFESQILMFSGDCLLTSTPIISPQNT